jgi:hypothetical protein
MNGTHRETGSYLSQAIPPPPTLRLLSQRTIHTLTDHDPDQFVGEGLSEPVGDVSMLHLPF